MSAMNYGSGGASLWLVSSSVLALTGQTGGQALMGTTLTAEMDGAPAAPGSVTWRVDGQVIAGQSDAALPVTGDFYGGALSAEVSGAVSDPAEVAAPDTAIRFMFEGSGDSFTTPPMVEGDMIVVLLRDNDTSTMVQGDCSLGTLLYANPNVNTHVNGMWTYKATAASTGIGVTLSENMSYICLNIGAYTLIGGGGRTKEGSAGGSSGFGSNPDTTAPNGLKLNFASRRNPTECYITDEYITAADWADPNPAQPPSLPTHNMVIDPPVDKRWNLQVLRINNAGSTGGWRMTSDTAYQRHSQITATFEADTHGADVVPATKYVADGNGAGRARTSTVSSFTAVDGIDVTLAAPHKVGHYISGNDGLGDIFVVGACQITAYTPAFVDDDRKRNGAMLSLGALHVDNASFVQGFDEQDTNSPTYSEAVRAAVPIDMVPGDSLVISRGQTGVVSGDNSKIRDYAVITCVSAVPFRDEFRPPYTWPAAAGAKPRHRLSDVDMGLLPTFTPPTGYVEPPNINLRPIDRFLFDPVTFWKRYGLVGSRHRPTYSRDLQSVEREAMMLLTLDRPFSVKRDALVALVQRGIDTYGVFRDARDKDPGSQPWEKDGGHNASRGSIIVLAGTLLGDAGMIGVRAQFHELDQAEYTTQAAIDYTNDAGWSPSGATPHEPYQQGMLDGQSLAYPMPDYVGDLSNDPDSGRWNVSWDRDTASFYRSTGNASTWQAEALLLAAMAAPEWTAVNDTAAGDPLYFDYTARHWSIETHGVDPWIRAGGGVDRYNMVGRVPAPSGVDEWWQQIFDANYIGGAYSYPWV